MAKQVNMAFEDFNFKIGDSATIHKSCAKGTAKKWRKAQKRNKIPTFKAPAKTSRILPTSQKSMDKMAGVALLDLLFEQFGIPDHVDFDSFLAVFSDTSPGQPPSQLALANKINSFLEDMSVEDDDTQQDLPEYISIPKLWLVSLTWG